MSSIKNQIQYNLLELHKVEDEVITETWELLPKRWMYQAGVRYSTTISYYKKADGLSLNSPWRYYTAPPSLQTVPPTSAPYPSCLYKLAGFSHISVTTIQSIHITLLAIYAWMCIIDINNIDNQIDAKTTFF